MNVTKKSGFTLIEIMIVVIIVGVLASLALPKFFSTVEYSRSQEALSAIATMRGGLERYYVSKSNSYTGATTANIDTGNPLLGQPNAHFVMTVNSALPVGGYTITATRNSVDGGNATHTVVLTQSTTTITRGGTTAFAGIN